MLMLHPTCDYEEWVIC